MPSSIKQLEFDRQLDLIRIREFRKSGDLGLLSELYEKYIYLIYGIGLKYFNDREKAQNLVVLIFEKLTIQANNQEIKNLRGWLYIVAKNSCLSELKIQNIDTFHLKRIEEESASKGSLIDLHPLDDDKRVSELIKDSISKLKGQQRECIELFYFNKKCFQNIADALCVDVESVKNNIRLGKENMKNWLENKHVG